MNTNVIIKRSYKLADYSIGELYVSKEGGEGVYVTIEN